jgi:membrane associated rhomboid family serine protease
MMMPGRSKNRLLFGQSANALMMLLAMLAIVFCILKFIQLTFVLSNPQAGSAMTVYKESIYKWFILPANLSVLLQRPWTLLTYMFVHDGVFHLIGNLIWLWVFGYILQDLAGAKTILPLFLYGALTGALFFIGSYNLFPGLRTALSGATLEGASAGIMAIALATTLLAPGYRFFPMLNGGIPLWVITVIYVIIDIAMIAGLTNAGGHISHIGGGLFGWVYMSQLQRGVDLGRGFHRFISWVDGLFSPSVEERRKSVRKDFFYKTSGTEPYKKTPHLSQNRIDAILDKIGQLGYDKLTEEEKQILKRAAEDENL